MDRKLKILLIEDNSDARELFALVLKRGGFDVIEAANGFEAIELAHTDLPDLILMDLMMPKISGDEATVQLKADPATKHIPIIVCTAAVRGEPLQRAMAAGAAKILLKPINLKGLVEEVREFLAGENNCSSDSTKPAPIDELRLELFH